MGVGSILVAMMVVVGAAGITWSSGMSATWTVLVSLAAGSTTLLLLAVVMFIVDTTDKKS